MIAVGIQILFLEENQSNNKFCCECGNNGFYLHDKRKEKMTLVGDVFGGGVGVAFLVKFITGSETGQWMDAERPRMLRVRFEWVVLRRVVGNGTGFEFLKRKRKELNRTLGDARERLIELDRRMMI